MNVRETLTKQLEVLEKAQEQAAADKDIEAIVKLSAQITAVVSVIMLL